MRVLIGKHLDSESFDPNLQGKTTLGELTTGPQGFLKWFGGLLGVIEPWRVRERTFAYQEALASEAAEAFYRASFEKDPLGVACRLLTVRDEIYRSAAKSFDLSLVKAVAPRLATLVRVEKAFLSQPRHQGGEAYILRRIGERLASGMRHPVRVLQLLEGRESWPLLWQELWQAMQARETEFADFVLPTVRSASHDLRTAQDALSGRGGGGDSGSSGSSGSGSVGPSSAAADLSLIHIRASYLSEAADALAAYLGARPNDEVTIIRGKEPRALDLGLARLGLPALGHYEATAGHPVVQSPPPPS